MDAGRLADFQSQGEVGMADLLGKVLFAQKAGELPHFLARPLGRQNFQGDVRRSARVQGEINIAHAAAAQDRPQLIRTNHQADRNPLQQFLSLEAGELPLTYHLLGKLAGVVARGRRHGAQCPLDLLPAKQTATQHRSHECIGLG